MTSIFQRWLVVIVENKPDKPFALEYYTLMNGIIQLDAQSAAEEAVERSNNAASEYPSNSVVGVMTAQQYSDLYNEDNEALCDPDTLTWFNVECTPVPYYQARSLELL